MDMENKILELAKELISVSSVKGNAGEMERVLEIAKRELPGISFKEYKNEGVSSLLFYNTKTLPKKFKLILNAHLDVVPGNPEQYKPKVEGDKLIGRGAYDMKAAAAAEILLFKELADKVNYPLGLQLVTDEEVGGFNGAKFEAKSGVDAECMLVGECSSDFTVSVVAKGIITLSIKFAGSSAHSAYLWEGKNAIFEMNQFLNRLWASYPIPKNKVWKTTVNVPVVSTSNVAGNKVPGDATLKLDIRYIPGDSENILNNIKSLLPKGSELEVSMMEPSMNTSENDPYVQGFIKIAEKTLDKKVQIVGKNGGCDLRHYPNAAGIEFGPVGEGPHTDYEWVSVKSLGTYYKIMKDYLLDLDYVSQGKK